MKNILFVTFFFIPIILSGQIDFDNHFENKSLRIDLNFTGSVNETKVYLYQLKQEPFWGGPKKNLSDTFNLGGLKLLVYDLNSKKLIYSKGFCSLFSEWQTTIEAKSSSFSFPHSLIIPFPKNKIQLEIHKRETFFTSKKIFGIIIDPKSYLICKDAPTKIKTTKIINSGESSKNIDIAIIAEGYTENEMNKFIRDAKRISKAIIHSAPFSKYKNDFNIWAIESVSKESGTDIPTKNIYNNTIANFRFSTFNIDRYLASIDSYSIRNIASNVPYDQIFVIVNSTEYGGSGFFNNYASCTADHLLTKEVAIHEFGHTFAGLADEYYNSEVPYENFYSLTIEPWEPNITTRNHFEIKWKDMIDPGTPVPTPRIAKFNSTIGVFEGGGYSVKGIFSPYMECRMKSNTSKDFCPICQRAISRIAVFYTDK